MTYAPLKPGRTNTVETKRTSPRPHISPPRPRVTAVPILQTKLVLGATNDPLEAEAEAIADRVIRSAPDSHAEAAPSVLPKIQRKCTAYSAKPDEETPRRKLVAPRHILPANPSEPHTLQTKLVLGAAHDPLEREADAVADRVMRSAAAPSLSAAIATTPTIQRTCATCEQKDGEMVQRACAACSQESEEDLIRRSATTQSATSAKVRPDIAARITMQRPRGRALDLDTRAFMEPRFGRDFSRVRVHTGPESVTLARTLNARAFTVGNDMFFGGNQYRPSSVPGRRLLAHELAHTVQQQGIVAAPTVRRAPPEDAPAGSTIEPEASAAELMGTGKHDTCKSIKDNWWTSEIRNAFRRDWFNDPDLRNLREALPFYSIEGGCEGTPQETSRTGDSILTTGEIANPSVALLQRVLMAWSCFELGTNPFYFDGVSGDYGSKTKYLVRKFQGGSWGKPQRLKQDGVVGPSTLWALDGFVTNMSKDLDDPDLLAAQKEQLTSDVVPTKEPFKYSWTDGEDGVCASTGMSGRTIVKATADGADLTALAKQITGVAQDWRCIIPCKMAAEPEIRDDSYAQQVRQCDEFDVSNLDYRIPGTSDNFSVVDDEKGNPTFPFDERKFTLDFFKANKFVETAKIEETIRELAGEGRTPIAQLEITGHTAGSKMWGLSTGPKFDLARIQKLGHGKPSFADARLGKLPRRCWFHRQARVILNGCSSASFGEWMALTYLRRASSLMTTLAGIQPMCWVPSEMRSCKTNLNSVMFSNHTLFVDGGGTMEGMIGRVASGCCPEFGPFLNLEAMRTSPNAKHNLPGLL